MEQTIPAFVERFACTCDFVHIAIVVHDIEQAIAAYCKLLGAERPTLKQTGAPEDAKVQFLGKSTPARAKQCFFTVGNLRIELMEPDENPSTWLDVLNESGDGLHHVGFNVKSMKDTMEELSAMGMPTIQTGLYNGGQYAYVDCRKQLGMMVELLETF